MNGRAIHHALSGVGMLVALGIVLFLLTRCAP